MGLNPMWQLIHIDSLLSSPQMSGTTELSMEGVKGVGSELERVHIAEKNKAMAAKLKVRMFPRLNSFNFQ